MATEEPTDEETHEIAQRGFRAGNSAGARRELIAHGWRECIEALRARAMDLYRKPHTEKTFAERGFDQHLLHAANELEQLAKERGYL